MPRGKYSNPYAQLGNSAADIVDTFINRKGLESSGYLSASKQMADIDNTRAGTGKILQELAGNDRANNLTAGDWNAARGGDFGQQMAISQTAGSQGSMTSILEALQGAQGGGMEGGANGLPNIEGIQSFFTGNLPIADRGEAMVNYLNSIGFTGPELEALKVGVATGDMVKTSDAMKALAGAPMQSLDYVTEPDTNTAMTMFGNAVNTARNRLNNPGRAAPKKYKYDPSTGLIPR